MRASIKLVFFLLGLGLLALSEPASALIQWNFSSPGCTPAASFGDSCSWTVGTIKVTATAWSNTQSTANTNLENAYLGAYPGLGVTNRDGTTATTSPSCTSGQDCAEGTIANTTPPEHAMDNNQRYDSILFTFTSTVTNLPVSVNLQDVQLSYPTSSSCSTCDSDISVLAYTGGGTGVYVPTGTSPNLTGATYAQMTAQGWTLVGDYSNVSSAPGMTALINQTGTPYEATQSSSPYWIVAAYSPVFTTSPAGGACDNATTGKTTTTCDSQNDYVKVIALYGSSTNKVPEPNTLLLIGVVATVGVWGKRRIARR